VRVAVGFIPPGQFVEADIEDVCDLDNRAE
jgi:hypothetical protein